MRFPQIVAVAAGLSVATAAAAAPTSHEVLGGMLKNAGGNTAFAKLGVIKLDADEAETLSDGTTNDGGFIGWVDAGSIRNFRLNLGPDVVLAVNGDTAWATVNGELDTRPQSNRKIPEAIHQKLFPLMLPFSLQWPGLTLGDVTEGQVEGTDTWRVSVTVPKGYFGVPSMDTTWYAHADRETLAFVAFESVPPVEIRKVTDEGMRFRPLKWQTLNGCKLPSQIMIDGIDFSFHPNGHVRITRVEATALGRFDPRLFLHPRKLEAFDRGDLPEDGPGGSS